MDICTVFICDSSVSLAHLTTPLAHGVLYIPSYQPPQFTTFLQHRAMTIPAPSEVPSGASFPNTNPGEQPTESLVVPALAGRASFYINAGEQPSRSLPVAYSAAASALSERGLNPNAESLNYYKNQIYVRGLPYSMTDAQLEASFRARFGAGVVNVKVWLTMQCGHVTFGSRRMVEEAVALGEWQEIRIERHRPQFPKTLLRALRVSPEDPNSQLYVAQAETELESLRKLYVERQQSMLAERLRLTLSTSYSLF
ncbi:hypothetical protein ABKV19_012620 [Rosa sericea]